MRRSGVVSLMPYLDQAPYYNVISAGDPTNNIPPGGSAAWQGWTGWRIRFPGMMCPSDPAPAYTNGNCSYAFSIGDWYTAGSGGHRDNVTFNGLFGVGSTKGVRDCVDGTSNTIAFSERAMASFGIGGKANADIREGMLTNVTAMATNGPGACLAAVAPISSGFRYTDASLVKGKFSSIWNDAQSENVGFLTVLGPNKPSCTNDTNGNADSTNAVLSASSYHTGGVHALMADGAVRFVSDNIDTGNLAALPAFGNASPYGTWGRLGTTNGGETVAEF
ncbi:hypothetical protein AYO47_05565 [Planctomyces sp. SCGC AG-212-M04]|nr:hypothetical protein AYO47_05565 [Planctomyces sp. SCGC AG-212-M04]